MRPETPLGWLSPLPKDVSITAKPKPGSHAIVHLFAPMMVDVERHLATARQARIQSGTLWVSLCKKSAKIPGHITKDRIGERLLKTKPVDVKICAVSDIWSGVRFVVRKREALEPRLCRGREALEEIMRIHRARRGFGVILHRENRAVFDPDPAIGVVE